MRRVAVAACLGFAAAAFGLPSISALAAAPTANSAITYVYDAAGRLEAAIDPTVTASTKGLVRYTYDDAGNLLSISRADATIATVVEIKGSSAQLNGAVGPAGQAGSIATIYGAGFSATASQDQVRFAGTGSGCSTGTSTVQTASQTILTVTVPSCAITGVVNVKNTASGKSANSPSFAVIGVSSPSISALSKTQGIPGDAVTITGARFSTTTANDLVLFNGTRAVVTAATATQITTTVPPGATSGTLEVRTPDGVGDASQDFIVFPRGTATDYSLITRMTNGGSSTISLTGNKKALILVHETQGTPFSALFSTLSGIDINNLWSYTIYDPFGRMVKLTYTAGGDNLLNVQTAPRSSGSNNTSPYASQAEVTGDYTILVEESTTNAGSTKLNLYDITPVQGGNVQPSVGGSSVSTTTVNPGQLGTFTFDGTAGQWVKIVTTVPATFTAMQVNPPPQPGISYPNLINWVSPPPSFQLPATGRYTVWVDPGFAGKGEVTGLVTNVVYSVSAPAGPARAAGSTGASAAPMAPTASYNQLLRGMVAGYHSPYPDSWIPTHADLTNWRTNRDPSPFANEQDLVASKGGTAISGHVLALSGRPLKGVTVSDGTISTLTDFAGRFLLSGVPAGDQEIVVDGSAVKSPDGTFGTFTIDATVTKDQTAPLGAPVWLPIQSSGESVHLTYPTTKQVVITNPSMPRFKLTIPKGATVTDDNGNPVSDINLTPIPLDRAPFPMPAFQEFQMRWAAQPGPLYVTGKGAGFEYGNYRNLPAGEQVPVWAYEPGNGGWKVYGNATISADGQHIVPDPGVRLWELAGAGSPGILGPLLNPNCAQTVLSQPLLPANCGGDPVDTSNGLFRYQHTDLSEPGPLPIDLTRVYRQNDSTLYRFGQSQALSYDLNLYSLDSYSYVDLQIPGAPTIKFTPLSGTTRPLYAPANAPGPWQGARLDECCGGVPGSPWIITRRDGMVYTFSENGNDVGSPLTEIRDRFGNALVFQRDAFNRLSLIKATPTGRWISFNYTTFAGGRAVVSSATDSAGRTVKYSYGEPVAGDGIVQLTGVQDAKQTTLQTPKSVVYAWEDCATYTNCQVVNGNASGLPSPATYLLSITDNQGNTAIKNVYDSQGRVTKQTLANGGTYLLSYSDSACSGGTKLTDPNGTVSCWTYDANGSLASLTTASGTPLARTLTYQRDPATSAVASVLDSFSSGGSSVTRTTSYTYDTSGPSSPTDGNLLTVTAPGGQSAAATTTYGYGPYAQIASIKDPLGHATTTSFTGPCATSVQDARGTTYTLTCNPYGQVKSVSDPYSNTFTLTYNSGDLSIVTDPNGNASAAFIANSGLPTTVTNAYGERTSYTYDPFNNPTSIADPRGKVITLAYDANENLLSATAPTMTQYGFAYNSMNLVKTRTDPAGKSDTYTYDAMNNLMQMGDRAGQTDLFCYDALDHLSFAGYKWTGTGNPTCNSSTYQSTTTYSPDPAGRLLQIADSAAGTTSQTFFNSDLQNTITTPQGSTAYTYDAAGRRQTMTAGSQAPVSYSYFTDNLIKQIAQGTNTVGYTYDRANRPAKLTLPNADTQTYTLDAAGNTSKISYDSGATNLGAISYGLDAVGRRSSAYGSWARIGLPAATSASAVYDSFHYELQSWNGTAVAYDPNGNMKSFGSQTYSWNARNQLTATSAGASSFSYDAFGRRTSKTVSGTSTKFLYDGPNVVQEQTGSGTPAANELTGLEIDQTYWRNDLAAGTQRTLLADAQGSTVALVDNAGIGVQTSYTYTPFGAQTATVTDSNPFQYTGREWDGATGLQYNRARYYNPSLGSFISQDPIGIASTIMRAPNVYAYGFDSPTVSTDLSGLDSTDTSGQVPGGPSAATVAGESAATLAACAAGATTFGEVGSVFGPVGIGVGAGIGCVVAGGAVGTAIINHQPVPPGLVG